MGRTSTKTRKIRQDVSKNQTGSSTGTAEGSKPLIDSEDDSVTENINEGDSSNFEVGLPPEASLEQSEENDTSDAGLENEKKRSKKQRKKINSLKKTKNDSDQENAGNNSSRKSSSLNIIKEKSHEKSKNSEDSSDESVTDGKDYEVEKIIQTRIYRGKRQYLVRWKGYSEKDDTWEHESHLDSSRKLVEEFNKSNSTKELKTNKKVVNEKANNKVETTLEQSDENYMSDAGVENGKKRSKKQSKKISTLKKIKIDIDQEDAGNKSSRKSSSLNIIKEKSNEKSKKSEDTSDESVTDGKYYKVEKIIQTRIYRGKKQYLVRWKGYSEKDDTWEHESHLDSSRKRVEEFNKSNSTKELKMNKKVGNEKANNKDEATLEPSDENYVSHAGLENGKKRSKKQSEKTSPLKKIKIVSDQENARNKSSRKSSSLNIIKEKSKDISKKSEDTSDESVTDGKNYEVEKILEMHIRQDGSKEFLIRWKGYTSSDDTWEPESHLDCKEMIEKFMEKVKKAKSIPPRELKECRQRPTVVPNLRGTGLKKSYHQLRN